MTGLRNYQISVYLLLAFWAATTILLVGFVVVGHRSLGENTRISGEQSLVRTLYLTDFCLATESRHTRHIALPEPIAPFQDVPAYLDHFPTSTFFWPPPQARQWNSLFTRKQTVPEENRLKELSVTARIRNGQASGSKQAESKRINQKKNREH